MASQVEQTELNSFVYKNHKTWRKLISGRSSLNISSASNKNNNQDRVMSGFCIEKKLDWLIICDGHGSNDVVDFLDMILIDDIICRCNSPVMFIQEIQKQLKEYFKEITYGSNQTNYVNSPKKGKKRRRQDKGQLNKPRKKRGNIKKQSMTPE